MRQTAGRRMWGASVLVLFFCLFAGACSLVERSSTQEVEAASGRLPAAQTYGTWEAAAVAEAIRLNPELTNAKAQRVHLRAVGPRMRVEAEGGYCHLFGAQSSDTGNGKRWVANDITKCQNLPDR